MARKLRVQYPGAIYHVMNRGDRRESIYEDDEDHSLFLETLGEACQKTDWQVHAWCLMSNHFHLVIETPPSSSFIATPPEAIGRLNSLPLTLAQAKGDFGPKPDCSLSH